MLNMKRRRERHMAKLSNLLPDYGTTRRIFLIGMSLLMVSSLLSAFTFSSTLASNVTNTICGIYSLVHTIIFVLGLLLIIIGAAMYAGSHVLPGNLKSSMQGYGMGMIVGGIVGVIIALSAPFILGVITGNTAAGTQCNGYTPIS